MGVNLLKTLNTKTQLTTIFRTGLVLLFLCIGQPVSRHAEAAGRTLVPQPFLPYGAVTAQYETTFGDSSESNEQVQLDLGALGYFLDQQLLWYDVRGFITEDSGNTGNEYGIFLDLNFLDVLGETRKFRKVPHPVRIHFDQYTTGTGEFTRGYGLGVSYFIPTWLRFFEGGEFVKLAATSGLEVARELEAVEGVDDIWSAPELEDFEPEPLDEGWGEGAGGEWSGDLGPVGWGDGTTVWEEAAPEKEERPSLEERKGPLFAVPFPMMGLDFFRMESEYDAPLGGTREESLDLLSGRMSFAGAYNTVDAGLSAERDQRGDRTADTNELRLRHVYRSPRRGPEERSTAWNLRERLTYTDRSVSDSSSIQFDGQHDWTRGNIRARKFLTSVTSFGWFDQANVSAYNGRTFLAYGTPLSQAFHSDTEGYLGYRSSNNTTGAEAGLKEEIEWSGTRLFSMRGDAEVFYSGDSSSSGGGTGGGLGLSAFTKTRIRFSDTIRTLVSQSGGQNRNTISNILRADGRIWGDINMRNQLEYRISNVSGEGQSVSQQILDYTLDASRSLTRWANLAAGGRYYNVTSDGGDSRLWTAYVNGRLQPLRSLSASWQFRLRNLDGNQESSMEVIGTYRYIFYRVEFGVDYRLEWVNSDITGADRSVHTVTVTARRSFG